jgi:hypothetical protein
MSLVHKNCDGKVVHKSTLALTRELENAFLPFLLKTRAYIPLVRVRTA